MENICVPLLKCSKYKKIIGVYVKKKALDFFIKDGFGIVIEICGTVGKPIFEAKCNTVVELKMLYAESLQ